MDVTCFKIKYKKLTNINIIDVKVLATTWEVRLLNNETSFVVFLLDR